MTRFLEWTILILAAALAYHCRALIGETLTVILGSPTLIVLSLAATLLLYGSQRRTGPKVATA